MEWPQAVPAAISLPLTAVSAFGPVIGDRSRLTQLECIARLADGSSLAGAERHRLSAARRLGTFLHSWSAARGTEFRNPWNARQHWDPGSAPPLQSANKPNTAYRRPSIHVTLEGV